jgi:23S rRNA (uracil1939-C5)-methyltransferase
LRQTRTGTLARRPSSHRSFRPPAPSGPPRTLAIDSVGAQGDGVAAGPVYAPLTLPGEQVRAAVAGDRAEALEILQASPERVAPPCPHFGACGGCALQHWDHRAYLAWKVEQIRAALARERIETDFAPAFSAAPGRRRRVALHARKGGAGVEIGYKARRSWRLVGIDTCPIADPRLVAAFPALRRLAAPLFEHPRSAPTLHATVTETGLDVDVTGVERKSGGLSADARVAVSEAAASADFARVTMSGETLYQARSPMVVFGHARVVLPPGGFLQAVPEAEAAMAAFAVEALAGAGLVADLFSGAGAFSFRLAERSRVLALDSAPEAIAALKGGLGSAPELKPIDAEVRDLFRRPLLVQEMKRVDAALFDPPRAGAADQARELARSRIERVVGVSCNPATFARDAALLVEGGFRLQRVLPVDQFLWSPHIELVGVFVRGSA